MVSVSVHLSRARLSTALDWQRTLDETGLPLQLDTSVNLHDFIGLLPVTYRGQESGFEYFVEHDAPPPDAIRAIGPGQFDTCVTLVSRSATESRAAVAAAAALATLTGGVVHDDAEGHGYSASEAIAWARRVVSEGNRGDSPMPQTYARLAGGLYLAIIALGIVAQVVVRDQLIVPRDAAATAQNLVTSQSLWRLGIAAEALAVPVTLTLAMIYFALLRPVSLELSILAALLRVVSVAVQAVAVLQLDLALSPLADPAFSAAFTPDQRAALASLAVRTHSHGYTLSLLILGAAFLVHGHLIIRSTFLPKVLGVLIQVAGVGYLVNGFTLILAPALSGQVFTVIMLPVFVGETSLSLWLLIKGVHVERWRQVAGAARLVQ